MPNRDPVTGRFTSGGGGGSSAGGFNLGNAYGSVSIDISGVGAAMKQAQSDIQSGLSGIGQKIGGSLKDVGGGLEDIGQSVAGVGLKIGALVTPIALFGKRAISQFSDFNEAMTNVQAVTGASADEIKALSDQILEVGKNSRSGPQAVAEAFYDIAGGVTDASVRMPTLIAAIKASEAGNADLGTTTKALISIMNGYGFSADKAGYATDVLTQVVSKGVGTMNDFAVALPDVAGLANTLGISFQDLGAMMSYITTKGVSASQAGTQLQGMMISLINPTQEMSDALKKIGFDSGKAAIAQLGLAGTFKKFKEAGIDVTQLGGRIEALRGIVTLTGDGAKEFLDNFSVGLKGLTEETQKIQNASPAAQLDFLNSAMSTLSITIGESLAPALTNLFAQMLPVIDSILAWVRQNPELVAQIGMIVGALTVALPVIAGIGLAISAVGSIIAGLGFVIGIVLSPIGLLIAAGAAIVYLFKDQIGAAISVAWDYISKGEGIFKGLAAGIMALFGDTPITRAIEQFLLQVQDFFDHFQDRVKLFGSLFQLYFEYYIGNPLSDLWAKVQPALQNLFNWFIADGLPAIQRFLLDVYNNVLLPVINFLADIWNRVSGALGNMWNWFVAPGGGLDTIKKAFSDFKTLIIEPVVKYLQDLWTNVQPALNTFKTEIGKIFGWIKDNVIQPVIDKVEAILGAVNKLAGVSNIGSGDVGAKTGLWKDGKPVGGTFTDVFGRGVVPLPPVGGGSSLPAGGGSIGIRANLRDVGGSGMSGMAYQIGRGQLQNEVYIPGADGQFVSGFVDLMKQVAAGVTNNGGDTIVQVQMPAAALANPAGAYAAGQDFGRGLADQMRSQGVKGVR